MTDTKESVDWDMLMRFGLGVLGLAPRDFWDMTPAELSAAAQGRSGNVARAAPLNRETLASLIRKHPDHAIPERGQLT